MKHFAGVDADTAEKGVDFVKSRQHFGKCLPQFLQICFFTSRILDARHTHIETTLQVLFQYVYVSHVDFQKLIDFSSTLHTPEVHLLPLCLLRFL